MKVYVAGSFKNKAKIRVLAQRLREAGLSCYVFCDKDEATNTLSEELRRYIELDLLKPNTALKLPIVQEIGRMNQVQLDLCDAVVLVLPCGKSAHMEAGVMIGRNLPVWIYGPMPRGEFDAMYVMARAVFDEHEFSELLASIKEYQG